MTLMTDEENEQMADHITGIRPVAAKTMRVQEITVKMHPTVRTQIRRHSRKQARRWNHEAVGFVARHPDGERPDTITASAPLHNHASNPQESFFVEPWEQFQAEQALKKAGYEIVGVYHSHVRGEALPSQTDHKMAWAGKFVFIYSVPFDGLSAYVEEDGILTPVTLDMVDDAQ